MKHLSGANTCAALIYELTLSERFFQSEDRDLKGLFLKAIHVVSSMCKQGQSLDIVIGFIREFYQSDVKAPAEGEKLIERVLTYLREHQ